MTKEFLSNDIADIVVAKMQADKASGGPDSATTQQFMNLVAGVHEYHISDMSKQGIIGRYFNREIRTPYGGGNPINFSMSFEDIVSIFWEHAYKALLDAKMTGDSVKVRVVTGQESNAETSKVNGVDKTDRITNCNPINYIRKTAITKTRNAITTSYVRGITQECQDCGNSSVPRKSEYTLTCPMCQSGETKEIYPEGTSMYRAKKARQCTKCTTVWQRRFRYTCQACKSDNVSLEQRLKTMDDAVLQIPSGIATVEVDKIASESDIEINNILLNIRSVLPKDPQSPGSKTAGIDIYDMFIDPALGKDVCKLCKSNARPVCAEKCGASKCSHPTMLDPTYTCGSDEFSLIECINYTKRLSDYYQCSTSLTSRRVKRNRLYAIRYIVNNQDKYDVCKNIVGLLKKRGTYKEYESQI